MPAYVINGVSVTFPYEAYEPQIEYMRNVIEALQKVLYDNLFKYTSHPPFFILSAHITNNFQSFFLVRLSIINFQV